MHTHAQYSLQFTYFKLTVRLNTRTHIFSCLISIEFCFFFLSVRQRTYRHFHSHGLFRICNQIAIDLKHKNEFTFYHTQTIVDLIECIWLRIAEHRPSARFSALYNWLSATRHIEINIRHNDHVREHEKYSIVHWTTIQLQSKSINANSTMYFTRDLYLFYAICRLCEMLLLNLSAEQVEIRSVGT